MASALAVRYGLGPVPQPRMTWDDRKLLFVVREPFVSKSSQASLVCGEVTPQSPLVLESEMAQRGLIFSDGIEADSLDFNAGVIATIGLAEHATRLVRPT